MIFFIILCFCYFSPISKKKVNYVFQTIIVHDEKKKKQETKMSKSVGLIVRLN